MSSRFVDELRALDELVVLRADEVVVLRALHHLVHFQIRLRSFF